MYIHIVPADDLAALGARTSAAKAMTKFVTGMNMGQALKGGVNTRLGKQFHCRYIYDNGRYLIVVPTPK